MNEGGCELLYHRNCPFSRERHPLSAPGTVFPKVADSDTTDNTLLQVQLRLRVSHENDCTSYCDTAVHVQVMHQLGTLCIQAHHQKTAAATKHMTASVLGLWMLKTQQFLNPSLNRLARQQLQESGLLQNLPAILADAADTLTEAAAAAAAAALEEVALSSSSSSSSSGSSNSSSNSSNTSSSNTSSHSSSRSSRSRSSNSSSTSSSTCVQSSAEKVLNTIGITHRLLNVYVRACSLLSSRTDQCFSLEAALPAAPAAVRLILATIQTCSRIRQVAGREGSPSPVFLAADDTAIRERSTQALVCAHLVMLELAEAVLMHSSKGTLLSLSGANELLLCPELMSCLAIMVLVTLLGTDTWTKKGACSSKGPKRVAGPAGSGSGSSSSSSGRQTTTTQSLSQQPAASAGYHQAGSSSSSSSAVISGSNSSSSVRLANGVSLDSLTPLSRGLFGLLSVDLAIVLDAARVALWGATCDPTSFGWLVDTYCFVMEYQVSPTC